MVILNSNRMTMKMSLL